MLKNRLSLIMMRKQKKKIHVQSLHKRHRRKLSIRKLIQGLADKPRINVVRSNKNIFAQVIDDSTGHTLFSVQTFGKNAVAKKATKESGKIVGTQMADMLKAKKITSVVFDRNGYKYHGVVASVAEGLRENGIKL